MAFVRSISPWVKFNARISTGSTQKMHHNGLFYADPKNMILALLHRRPVEPDHDGRVNRGSVFRRLVSHSGRPGGIWRDFIGQRDWLPAEGLTR
jgi:hypothetical protein